ncbi:MAG: hypothetical protein ABIH11_08180 [Candidatus Altiarchaeota archaeon]
MDDPVEYDGAGELYRVIEAQFGCAITLEGRLYSRLQKKSTRLFLYAGGEPPCLRQSWIGLHIGDLSEGTIHPSIEGAQIIGEKATKNVMRVSHEQADALFKEGSIEHKPFDGIVLVKSGQNIICAAKHSNGRLVGLIPASRKTTL